MITDLFQGGDGGQDRALAFRTFLVGRFDDQAVEHRLIQADLLRCHGAVIEFVNPIGQLGGDLRFGLGATEDKNPVQRSKCTLSGVFGVSDV